MLPLSEEAEAIVAGLMISNAPRATVRYYLSNPMRMLGHNLAVVGALGASHMAGFWAGYFAGQSRAH